jgi:hypothetical protein
MENNKKRFSLKNPKLWQFVAIALGVLYVLTQIKSCSVEKAYNSEVQKNLDYEHKLETYAAQDGTLVNYNNALQTQLEAFFEAQNDSVREFLNNIKIPEPDVVTVYKDIFYVDSIPSVGLGLTDCDFDTTFNIVDPYYEIKGRVTDEALSLESIMIPNNTTLVIGDRKTKWWKRKEYIATVTHSNPHIQTQSIGSYVFKEKQSRWSVGPSIGYGFYYDPWKGNVGHGLTGGVSINYRLIGWKKK